MNTSMVLGEHPGHWAGALPPPGRRMAGWAKAITQRMDQATGPQGLSEVMGPARPLTAALKSAQALFFSVKAR
jgi:hypothetical protein